jgi:hypothetical protein
MICHRCGAEIGDEARLYCLHCGARQAGGVGDPAAYRTHPERFALVAQQPAFAAAMAWRPRLRAVRELGVPLAMTAFGSGFVAIGLLFAAREPGFGVAWLVICGLFIAACVYELGTSLLRVLAPTRAVVAVIVGDRPRQNTLAPHAVTLQVADGAQRRSVAHAALMNLVTVGDVGIAYTQRDRLVDFRWFDVMPADVPAGALAKPPSCPHCAAPVTLETRDVCLYCGHAVPEPDLGEHGARFAAAAESEAGQAALAGASVPHLPSLTGPLLVLGLGLLGLYGAWTYRMLFFLAYDHWRWGLLFLVPVAALTCVGAVWLARRARLHVGARRMVVARIVRTRNPVVVTVNGRVARRHHYVTIAAASGGRAELRCMPILTTIALDDAIGIADVRGEWLAAFTIAP